MLPLFDKHTCDISEEEYKMLPDVISYLESMPPVRITAELMLEDEKLSHLNLNPHRLKKLLSFIRRFKPDSDKPAGIAIRSDFDGRLRLLCSSSDGFWLSHNDDEWTMQIKTISMRSLGVFMNAFQYVDRMPDEWELRQTMSMIKTNLQTIIAILEKRNTNE